MSERKSHLRQVVENAPRIILASLAAFGGFLLLTQIAFGPVEASIFPPKPAIELPNGPSSARLNIVGAATTARPDEAPPKPADVCVRQANVMAMSQGLNVTHPVMINGEQVMIKDVPCD